MKERLGLTVAWAGLQWSLRSRYVLSENGVRHSGASCFNGYVFSCGGGDYEFKFPSNTSGTLKKAGLTVGSIARKGRTWEIEFCGESMTGKLDEESIEILKGLQSVATLTREGYLSWSARVNEEKSALVPIVIAFIFFVMTE